MWQPHVLRPITPCQALGDLHKYITTSGRGINSVATRNGHDYQSVFDAYFLGNTRVRSSPLFQSLQIANRTKYYSILLICCLLRKPLPRLSRDHTSNHGTLTVIISYIKYDNRLIRFCLTALTTWAKLRVVAWNRTAGPRRMVILSRIFQSSE